MDDAPGRRLFRVVHAALDLPNDPQVRSERTGSRAGHDTVWGDADALRACVAWVVPVEEDEETR